MKINHGDTGSALKFQWTYVSSTYSNQDGRNNSRNDSSGTSIRSSEVFPRNRFHHAACCLGQYVYIFGGKDRYSPLRDMWRFDTVTQEWEQIDDVKSRIPHLQGHTMLPYKTQLLIFGGTFSETHADTPLWIYKTDLNHVHKFCCESYRASPVGRREHSAVVYKASMYIYGGFLDSSGSTDEFWVFSIEENEWKIIRRHKPGKRHGHAAVVADCKMWIHGGMRGLMALSDLWAYNFGMNTWNKIRGAGVSPTLSNHTAHVVDKSIILFGGSISGSLSQDVWVFRIDTLTWRQISTQHGDQCPPTTLHTSVLLSAEPSQNVVKSRAHSLPYLKGQSVLSSELRCGRPWTSPTVDSSSEFVTSESKASRGVDVLRLGTVRTPSDGNNNDNRSDIRGRSDMQTIEAETSFFSADHNHGSIELPAEQTIRWLNSGVDSCPCHSNNKDQAFTQHAEANKIRPASTELCGDVVPLLERFHSVTSDVDLGENNLTITLSDEEICQSQGNTQLNNISQRSGRNMCIDNRGHAGQCAADTYFHNMNSKKAFITKDELLVKEQTTELLNFDQFRYPVGNRASNNVIQCVSIESGEICDMKIRNSMPKCLSNGQIAGLVDVTTVRPMSELECVGKSVTPISISNLPNGFPRAWAWEEKGKQDLKCTSDLIVEDLESNNFSELLRNIKIPSPPKSYFRSTSLKNLYSCINDLLDRVEPPELTKSHWTVSCDNLVPWQNNEYEVRDFKSPSCISKNTIKTLTEVQPKKETLPLEKQPSSGKYIKHVAPYAWRYPSYLLRFQGSLYKCPDSAKISVGTQTTDSHTFLPGPKSSLTAAHQSSQVAQCVAPITAVDRDHQQESLQSIHGQANPTTSASSMFIGGKMCILVIGGKMENHSFQAEPLKIWRCCLQ
ncbi:hypothetical protein BsWGS_01955 [Bradybaena similaris]